MKLDGFVKFAGKNLFGLVSAGLSAVILLIFLSASGGAGALTASIAGMRKTWLAAALACTFAFWLADGFILHSFIRMKYKRHSFAGSFKTTLIGLLYNCLTPFASGGQPMQVYDMARGGIDAGDAAACVTAKSVVYQICLTLYAAVALFFTLDFFRGHIPGFAPLLWLGMALNALFIAAAFTVTLNRSLAEKLGLTAVGALARLRIIKVKAKTAETVLNHIRLFNKNSALIYRSKAELAVPFLATIIQLALYYGITYLIYRGFDLSGSSFGLIMSAQAILTLITAFVPIPGGSGAAEAGFYVFFKIFFVRGAIVPAVFIWRILTYYACIVAGGAVSVWNMRR